VCHSRVGAQHAAPVFAFPAKAKIQVCSPHQKPLDTTHDKGNLIEDIVVDNPQEGMMDVGTTGVPTYLAAVGLRIRGITFGRR
jgi:hypothetical protein